MEMKSPPLRIVTSSTPPDSIGPITRARAGSVSPLTSDFMHARSGTPVSAGFLPSRYTVGQFTSELCKAGIFAICSAVRCPGSTSSTGSLGAVNAPQHVQNAVTRRKIITTLSGVSDADDALRENRRVEPLTRIVGACTLLGVVVLRTERRCFCALRTAVR